MTVKVKYSDFHQVTRSRTLPALIDCQIAMERTSVDLLRSLFPFPRGVYLIGITVSNLSSDGAASPAQLPLSFE